MKQHHMRFHLRQWPQLRGRAQAEGSKFNPSLESLTQGYPMEGDMKTVGIPEEQLPIRTDSIDPNEPMVHLKIRQFHAVNNM